MKVLVIGEGPVEHALVWKLSQSRHINKIYCCPGNIGISEIAQCIDVNPYNFRTLIDFVKYEWIDLTIVGPIELFLKGIVNAFEKEGCRILGPEKAATQFMTSRVSVKNLMLQHQVPMPEYKVFTSYLHAQDYIRLKGTPLVIKHNSTLYRNDIFTVLTIEEALDALKMIMEERISGDIGKRVIVEESLQGDKASFITVTDGKTISPFTDLRKHGSIGKDMRGLHGMFTVAFSPAGIITKELSDVIMKRLMVPLLNALKSKGIQYKGILTADLTFVQKRPYINELQCCFQNPDTQTVLPLLHNDFVDLAFSVIEERLSDIKIECSQKTSVCIVVSSKDYYREDQKKIIIHEFDKIKSLKDVILFQGGKSLSHNKAVHEDESLKSIIAIGNNKREAKDKAYSAIEKIHPDGIYYRENIGNNNPN